MHELFPFILSYFCDSEVCLYLKVFLFKMALVSDIHYMVLEEEFVTWRICHMYVAPLSFVIVCFQFLSSIKLVLIT